MPVSSRQLSRSLRSAASGEALGVAAIVRDISERKRAEADLRKFALQLRTAADVSAQVTTILDPTGC